MNSVRPLFTIAIASYNYANYLPKGLNAIRNQTFRDFNVLISDDCSTDKSVDIIRRFQSENPDLDIRIIENAQNQGLVANKNILIHECTGQYLMLCDADDWMCEDCLEKMADVIARERPDRVISQVAHIDEKGHIIQTEYIPENQTKWGWNIHHGSVYRVDLIREHGIDIKGNLDDVFFTIEFAKYCNKVSVIHETLYYWLMHLDSAGRQKADRFDVEAVRNNIGSVFKFTAKIIEDISKESKADKQQTIDELRLVRLKLYYFYILFAFQKESYHNKTVVYRELRHVIRQTDCKYLDNPLIYEKTKVYLRDYAMRAIKLCVLLERMPVALFGYHILTKVKYFDQ